MGGNLRKPTARRLIAMMLLLRPSATAFVTGWRQELMTLSSFREIIRGTATTGARRLRTAQLLQRAKNRLAQPHFDQPLYDPDHPRKTRMDQKVSPATPRVSIFQRALRCAPRFLMPVPLSTTPGLHHSSFSTRSTPSIVTLRFIHGLVRHLPLSGGSDLTPRSVATRSTVTRSTRSCSNTDAIGVRRIA